jgi:methionyl-tRNA synthetase
MIIVYTAILCDAISRFHRVNGEDIFFSIGTDEHGSKI